MYVETQPETFTDLINKISSLREKCTKKIIIRENSVEYKKPWFTENLLKLTKSRKFYYDLSRKFPNNEFYKNNYKKLRSMVSKTIELERKKYYDKKFDGNIKNLRRLWSTINEVIYNKSKINATNIPKRIIHNNIQYENPSDVVNVLNKYFANI